jgi:flagellar assembly protein FliH
VKKLLYKGGSAAAAATFTMPALTESRAAIGRTADHVEREAYERGYASGEKAGFEMGEQKANVLLDRLDALLRDLATLRERTAKDAELQCLALSLSMARKIVGHELAGHPEQIVLMAKEALMKLERTGQITIKLNPALYDFFMKHKPELSRIHPDITFDADPSVSPLGTVVMGPVEDVVTDIDEQFKNMLKDLVDAYARH